MSLYFSKIASGLNVLPLQLALLRQPELFGEHQERAEGESPHKAMSDIWVRYNALENLTDPESSHKPHDSIWYPAYYSLPQVREIIFTVMRLVDGERLGGVLITKLPAGGKIAPHVDEGWHAGYYDKFYVPILNAPGAVFGFPDGVISPSLGDVFWFRNNVPHWVDNPTDCDRIAMIVCIRTHKYKG